MKKPWFIFGCKKYLEFFRLTHESPVYSCGVVAGRPCHHEYMCTTYGGLRVGGYSVLPSHPAFFLRFYQGYLGFARSSRLFVMFGLKTIFGGKKSATKTCFLFKKKEKKFICLTKMEFFKDILYGLPRV